MTIRLAGMYRCYMLAGVLMRGQFFYDLAGGEVWRDDLGRGLVERGIWFCNVS